MERCRKRLEQFLIDLLEPVGRSERRHWGAVYVRGLLLDGERKSVEPMAKRLPDGNEQALQQFVGQSPWEWVPVWERLSRRMVRELEPEALWVVDDTGFPKQGEHSVGVARQYRVGGGEKWGHFGGLEGATCVVAQWTLGRHQKSCIPVWVALRQLWLPLGNRALLPAGRRCSL